MLFYLLDSRRLQILHILVCQSNTLQVRTLVLKGEIISYFCCYKIIVISILSSLRENNVSYSLVDIDQLCLSKTFDPFLTNEEGPFLSRCSRFFHPPQVRKFPAWSGGQPWPSWRCRLPRSVHQFHRERTHFAVLHPHSGKKEFLHYSMEKSISVLIKKLLNYSIKSQLLWSKTSSVCWLD